VSTLVCALLGVLTGWPIGVIGVERDWSLARTLTVGTLNGIAVWLLAAAYVLTKGGVL